MNNYDAIVVGGGINGLIAGAVLGRKGKKVCIIEKSDSFGGMASYTVDGGPTLAHALYNLSPRALKDAGIEPGHATLAGQEIDTVSLSDDGNHIVFKTTTDQSLHGKQRIVGIGHRLTLGRLPNQ